METPVYTNYNLLYNRDSYSKYVDSILDGSQTKNQGQELDIDTCLVKMANYPDDKTWAKKMNNLIYETSRLISQGEDIEDILFVIEAAVHTLNMGRAYGLRTDQDIHTFLIREDTRGQEYLTRYWKKILEKYPKDYQVEKSKEFPNANRGTLSSYYGNINAPIKAIRYYLHRNNNINYKLIKKEYDKLRNLKNPTEKDINDTCAKINWLMAQGLPYSRGGNSIATVLTRAIEHSYGIDVSAVKKGKSLDFEAFDLNLEDYVALYPNLFVRKPEKIN